MSDSLILSHKEKGQKMHLISILSAQMIRFSHLEFKNKNTVAQYQPALLEIQKMHGCAL